MIIYIHIYLFFSVMQKIISSIMDNDVITPIRTLMEERRRQKRTGKSRCHSIYREILFLSMAALQRDNIDQGNTLFLLTLR